MTIERANDSVIAIESDDGFWRNKEGEALHVSASDLERHAYCPLSWALARDGKTGRGEAISAGREKHAEIHQKVSGFKQKQNELKRALVIWSWWFAIIIIFISDAIIFMTISNTRAPEDVARYLTILAIVWLFLGLIAVYLPWRKWLDIPIQRTNEFDELKPKIADLVSKQRKLLTGVLAESKKILADGDTKEGGFLLLRAVSYTHLTLPTKRIV